MAHEEYMATNAQRPPVVKVWFLEPTIGTDPWTGEAFRSELHSVVATRSTRDGALTRFFTDAGQEVAAWPSAAIAAVLWPDGVTAVRPDDVESVGLELADGGGDDGKNETPNGNTPVRSDDTEYMGLAPDASPRGGGAMREASDGSSSGPPNITVLLDDELGPPLTARAINALHRFKIRTWTELELVDHDVILSLTNVGQKTLDNIVQALEERKSLNLPRDVIEVNAAAVHEELRDELHGLGERRRSVVLARVLRAPPVTLEEIGQQLGVSRERVRQIEQKSVQLLRSRFQRRICAVSWIVDEVIRLDPTNSEDLHAVLRQVAPAGTNTRALVLLGRLAGFTQEYVVGLFDE